MPRASAMAGKLRGLPGKCDHVHVIQADPREQRPKTLLQSSETAFELTENITAEDRNLPTPRIERL